MARGVEVLEMICPLGGWIITADDFDSIVWVDDRPRCTKQEFLDGFAKVDAFKEEQEAKRATDKAALLERLGMTEDEAKLLLG
jgi:hypothetical protein